MGQTKEAIFDFSGANLGPPRKDYWLSNQQALNAYANKILAQGEQGFIKPRELEHLAENVDAVQAIKNLPPGLTSNDFIGILRLSFLTECATDSYAKVFLESARKYDQPWLGLFIRDFWTPDEYGHHLPFKTMLMQLGDTEAELDRQIKDARNIEYIHGAGITPIHLTMFGAPQERITANWYGFTRGILKDTSPEAAKMVGRVQGREGLHARMYTDLSALQIEDNPRLLPHVAESLVRFKMPGNQIAPDLEAKVEGWLPHLNADLQKIKRQLIELTFDSLGRDPKKAGRVLMEILAQTGEKIGPVPTKLVNNALTQLGGPGYGIIGEALLEKVGIKYQFQEPKEDSSLTQYNDQKPARVLQRIGHNAVGTQSAPAQEAVTMLRTKLRKWVGRKIDERLGSVV